MPESAMTRWLVASILLVSPLAAAAPPWNIGARIGGERTDVNLRRSEHSTDQRSGYSIELELEVEVMPRLALALFAREDTHTGPASTRFEDTFVGTRAKVHIVPWLVADAGIALVREHERDPRDSDHSGLGVELGLAARLGPWGPLDLEALLDFGRFSMTGFAYVPERGNADWTRLSLALRFQ
jgi:hypothetical protein